MKTVLMTCLAMFFSVGANAELITDSDAHTLTLGTIDAPVKTWTIEATLQAQGVAGTASPLFGPAAFYNLTPRHHLGLRTLAPISSATEQGSFLAQALWRYFVIERRTSLFTEVSYAYNMVENAKFDSYSGAIGVRYLLNDDIAFGGLAGFEVADASVGTDNVVAGSDTYIYPRSSIFASMFF